MQTLGEFIVEQQSKHPRASGELSALFSAMLLAAKVVNREINKAGLLNIFGPTDEINIQGEEQQKLDVFANEKFKVALSARGVVCGLASEEEDSFVSFDESLNKKAKYIVLIDPLDGSSNIDVNVSVGTIFSIFKRISPIGSAVEESDFLQKGRDQVAAGYVVYGSSTMMVFSTGDGVNGFTFDPSIGVFCLSHPNIQVPQDGTIYSINEGNYEKFPKGIKQYIKYCQEVDKSTHRPYSSRYIGSFVSDFHRNMIKGGVYLYPSSKRYPNGKLRLLYECNPLAYLIEQAGGLAMTEKQGEHILDVEPNELHQRCPIIIGSKNMVNKVLDFLKND